MAVSSLTRHVAFYEGILGTSFELQSLGLEGHGPAAERAALAEIDRLEPIFSRFRADSELARWETTRNEPVPLSPEFVEVLGRAEHWRSVTQGAFNPVAESREPSVCNEPLWRIEADGRVTRLTSQRMSFNAIAKGFIADAAARAAQATGAETVLVNLGGDLRHLGPKPVQVAIPDPFAPAENAAPHDVIRIQNQGVATSGTYRRGAHLIDPKTGQASNHLASVTVVADSTMDADALATALFIMPMRAGLDLANRLNLAVLLVDQSRKAHFSRSWRTLRS